MVDPILVDYDGLIPNNVGLNADPRLRRALENWHPGCIDWWKERGPEGFQDPIPSIFAPLSASSRRAGPGSAMSECRNIAGAFCLRRRSRTVGSGSARTRANRSGRKCRANTARCCAA